MSKPHSSVSVCASWHQERQLVTKIFCTSHTLGSKFLPTHAIHLFYGHYTGQLALAGTIPVIWKILLVLNFAAHVPLLAATSAFGLVRRCWSSVEEFTDYDSVVVFSAVARAYIAKFFLTSH